MRILILGAGSYIGSGLKKRLEENYKNVYGTYRTAAAGYDGDASMYQYSLGDDDALSYVLEQAEPDYVISCLRGDFKEQLRTHRMAAEYLAVRSGKMIFISTANVFDAALDRAHLEGDLPKSDSEYGRFKIQCERELQGILGEDAVIIRIPGVWGKDSPRLQRLVEDLDSRHAVATYKNLYVNITTDIQVAEWVLYIIQHDLRGIFHVGTKDITEYLAFHRGLTAALGREEPAFQITDCEIRQVQAVIPGRDEIPDSMQMTVKAVTEYLALVSA